MPPHNLKKSEENVEIKCKKNWEKVQNKLRKKWEKSFKKGEKSWKKVEKKTVEKKFENYPNVLKSTQKHQKVPKVHINTQ